MPASGFEIMGRGLKRDGLERRFYVTGAADEGEVFDWLDANIDDYEDGYWASDWNADEVEGIVGDYIATVTWGRPAIPVAPAANTVDYKFNFRAPGGHLYQSLSTILYSSASGSNADPAVVAARNFGGAINVVNDDGKDRVEGFNLSPPNEVFTLGYNEGDSVITGAYQDTVADLCGKVNNTSFRSKAAGQIMLVRATGGRSSTGVWTIELGFGYIPNATSIPVGDNLTVTAKDGFDLLWPYYGTVKDDDADALVKQPTFAYVERIFERADLETELDLPA